MATPSRDHDWTATALFSPSKARVQQAQAKDWAAVDAWLANKYAPAKRLPAFEKHEDTLNALLTLASLNESADEQRTLLDRVHKSALQSLRKSNAPDPSTDNDIKPLYQTLESNEALTALAESSVLLNAADVRTEVLASAIADLTAEQFAADQELHRTQDQLSALKTERQKADAQLAQLKRDVFQPPEELGQQTNEWLRNAKQLKAKLAEYDERLGIARSAQQQPKIKVEDIAKLEKELSAEQDRLSEADVQLQAFQSMPPDVKAARAKLEAARDELRSLVKKRDRLFEQMAEGG